MKLGVLAAKEIAATKSQRHKGITDLHGNTFSHRRIKIVSSGIGQPHFRQRRIKCGQSEANEAEVQLADRPDSAVLSFPSGQKESTKESALLNRSDIFARILRNGLRCATQAVRAIQGRLFFGRPAPSLAGCLGHPFLPTAG